MNIIKVNANKEQVRTVIPEKLYHWINPSMGGATELIMYAAIEEKNEEEKEVLGFILYGRTKECDNVYQVIYISVKEQNRGKGIAKELTRVSAEYIWKQGAAKIVFSEEVDDNYGKLLLDGNVDYEEKKSAILFYTVQAVKKAVISDSMNMFEPLFKNIRTKDEITDAGMIVQLEKDTYKKNNKVVFEEVDSDNSCFWVSGNRICAYMIITDMEEGCFFVKHMEMLHKNDFTQYAIPVMMAYMVRKLTKNYSDDTKFGINILDTRLVEPTIKLLGEPDELVEYKDYYLA